MRATATVLAGFALIALMLAWSRWLAGRRRPAIGHALLATIAPVVAIPLWLVAGSLAAYEPIDATQPIAELLLEQTGGLQFRATLTRMPGGRMQVLELPGREWRIDARTLEWRATASHLGLRPLYQVERIATRDVPPADAPGTVAADFLLGEAAAGDLWTWVHASSRRDALAAAHRWYGPWVPLANGARYQVRLDGRGIVVEPMNPPAAEAMRAPR